MHPPEGGGEDPPTAGDAPTLGEGGRATTLTSSTTPSTGSAPAAASCPTPFPLLATPFFTAGEGAVPDDGRLRTISNKSSSLICFVPKERAFGERGRKGRRKEGGEEG